MKSWLPSRHRAYPIIALLAGVVALVRCATIVKVYNHTTDELAHIAGAVGLYESGRNIYMVEHPTLQRLVVGAALRVAGVRYPAAEKLKEVQARADANLAGADIVFRGKVDYWKVLAVARCANLVFLALLLFYVYRMGRYLAGPRAAMLATLFLSLEPNFLAHSVLVTTDVPAAAGFLMAAYYGVRFVARPGGKRALLAGIGLGLACSCKFTCVLVVPGIMMLAGVRWWRDRWRNGSTRTPRRFPAVRLWLAMAGVAFVTLWATYLFNVGRLADQKLFVTEKTWNKIPDGLKQIPIPMPAMPLGLMFMAALGKTGFPCYFNGRIDLSGHLLYFPEAIALKSPTGFLIALALAATLFAATRRRRMMLTLALALPPSLLMLTAMTGKLQIGIRHVLPVFPFLYLFVALQLHRGIRTLLLAALIGLASVASFRAHPDYLPFFNPLVGGAENGSKYLADSNIDWGQDVARLAEYLKSTGRTDYTIAVSGVRVADLVQHLGLDPASRERDPEELRRRPHGLVALGVNARLRLEGAKRTEDGELILGPDWSWATSYPVIKQIGQSICIYDLDAPTGN